VAGKFVLRSSKRGEFRFNLRAANGQVILKSQSYRTKAAALTAIRSAAQNAGIEECFERKMTPDGRAFFNLKSPNGQVIGKSQMYSSASSLTKRG